MNTFSQPLFLNAQKHKKWIFDPQDSIQKTFGFSIQTIQLKNAILTRVKRFGIFDP